MADRATPKQIVYIKDLLARLEKQARTDRWAKGEPIVQRFWDALDIDAVDNLTSSQASRLIEFLRIHSDVRRFMDATINTIGGQSDAAKAMFVFASACNIVRDALRAAGVDC